MMVFVFIFFMPYINIWDVFFVFSISELNGLSKELNIQLMNDGQPQESKDITDCLLIFVFY